MVDFWSKKAIQKKDEFFDEIVSQQGVLDLAGTGTESAQIWKLVLTSNLTTVVLFNNISYISNRLKAEIIYQIVEKQKL